MCLALCLEDMPLAGNDIGGRPPWAGHPTWEDLHPLCQRGLAGLNGQSFGLCLPIPGNGKGFPGGPTGLRIPTSLPISIFFTPDHPGQLGHSGNPRTGGPAGNPGELFSQHAGMFLNHLRIERPGIGQGLGSASTFPIRAKSRKHPSLAGQADKPALIAPFRLACAGDAFHAGIPFRPSPYSASFTHPI